ncbi:MAG TPA: VOC family protein [Waddliaceae bacterium]
MSIKGFHLAWIVVKDFKKAVKFYTEVVGLTIQNIDENYGWAELIGEDGAVLGISQQSEHNNIQAGQNAVVTLTVEDIVKAGAELAKKGMKMVGEIMEVPGHVKLQMCVDQDGNHFQLCQCLD